MDHHAHSILRAPPVDLDAFRGLFSESADPRQWPHVATTVTYQWAIELLAAELGCNAGEEAVFEYRRGADPEGYASDLPTASAAEVLLIDEAYPPTGEALSTTEWGSRSLSLAPPIAPRALIWPSSCELHLAPSTQRRPFTGLSLWARLGSNQRPLACEARDQLAFSLLIGTICIWRLSVHTPW